MKLTTSVLGICLTLILLTPRLSVAADDDYVDSIKTFLHDNFDARNVGMVVGLVDEHEVRVLSAGKLDNGADESVNGDTIFEIGSITKTFTALLLQDMIERGVMKPDDPVSKYLPKSVRLPARNGKEIILLDLATQSSGLPFDADNLAPKVPANRFADYTAEDLYAFLSAYTLTQEPGAKFRYSNVGMGLLGHAIELKAGSGFESLVVERVCSPLHMDSTRITLSPEMKARFAAGHDKVGKRVSNFDFQVMAGAGALRSTANDLLKYVSANLGLTRSGLEPLMAKTHIVRHRDARIGDNDAFDGRSAMPWVDQGVYSPPGSDLLGHGGGTGGYSAFIGFDLKQRRGVVVLSNQREAIISSTVGWRILQRARLTGPDPLTMMPQRQIVGLGTALELDPQSRTLRVTKVVPNSPAAQAGLAAGVVVKSIDGVSTSDKPLAECLALLRGQEGTKVRLELADRARPGDDRAVELTRSRVLIDQ